MIQELLSLPKTDLILRTRWYVRIRWFLLLAISVPGVLSLYIIQGWSPEVRGDLTLAVAAVASNGVFYFLSRLKRSERYYYRLAAVLLVVDVLFVTALIMTKGGVESRSVILYVMPILMSAVIFGRRAVYGVAGAAAILYNTVIIADYYDVIHTTGAINPYLRDDFGFMVNSVFFFTSILLVMGALADFIVRLLTEKEREASANAEALKRAQGIAKLGSWEWDVSTDVISWSDQLYAIYGLERQGVGLGYDEYIERVHPDDRVYVSSTIADSTETGKPFSFDHRIVRLDGGVRYVHGEGQAVFDDYGNLVKMIGTAQDVTADKALERAKSEFVSLASHQLRTPATGVKAFLSLLTEGYAGEMNEDQRRYLKKAYSANERQLHIIDDLLNIANIESGKVALDKQSVDLVAFTEAIIGEHSPIADALNQSIVFKRPKQPIIVDIDQTRFQMVIDNLISNACKYTDKGGSLTITVRKLKGKVVLEVADTGIGIAKKDVSDLFQKFYRIQNSHHISVEGNGLGLYLAKHIIELHRGTIAVRSTLGKGSTFTVTISGSNKKVAKSRSITLPDKKYHLRSSSEVNLKSVNDVRSKQFVKDAA